MDIEERFEVAINNRRAKIVQRTPDSLPIGALVRVIGYLAPGWWRVVVGPGLGMLNGGAEQDWPEAWIPAPARWPNGEFRVSGFESGVPRIVVE